MLKKTVVVVLIITSTLLNACNKHEQDKHAALLKLIVTQPLRKDTSIIKEYVSQIHAFKHIELRALERGYLQETFVDEGQMVKKGQKMFKIMPNFYQVDLLKAKAEAELVRIEFQNTQALAEQNIVSKTELALAAAKLNKAQAEVKLAQTHLDFTNINAPFTGIMDHFNVRNGSLVDEGELLTTLSDISKVWVYFNVPEAEYLDYKTKKVDATPLKVKLKMANGEIFDKTGVIEVIEADFDNKTGNIEFRAVFDNPQQVLRHGETGNIQVDIPYPNALMIPQKATFEILDKTYVYVVNKDHRLSQRLIHIAAELPHVYLVKDGLAEDDQVLIEGLRRVHNGEAINPNFQPAEKVLSELALHAE